MWPSSGGWRRVSVVPVTDPFLAGAAEPVLLDYPFTGRWMAKNSPARRVPSHGSHLFGTTYAVDFIAVDAFGRSASFGWRAAFGTEPPERFVGFGRRVLAPMAGTVAAVEQGQVDHVARRSVPAGLAYLLTQGRRARAGVAAVAGNHVVIAGPGVFVLVAHLRRGSLGVRVGDTVAVGDLLGECGNSGNSTQPHIHLQAMDSMVWDRVRGLPIRFHGVAGPELPGESQIVETHGMVG